MYQSRNGISITQEEAEEIHIDLRDGIPMSVIAEEWGITREAVADINYGRTYKILRFKYPIRE